MESVDKLEVPGKVRHAVNLLWTSAALVALFVLAVAAGLVSLPGQPTITLGDIITNAVTIALLALLANKLWKGRNWARWVLAVVAGFGAVAMIFSMLVVPDMWRSASLFLYGFALLQTALQVWAVVLVFSAQARPWFGQNAAV